MAIKSARFFGVCESTFALQGHHQTDWTVNILTLITIVCITMRAQYINPSLYNRKPDDSFLKLALKLVWCPYKAKVNSHTPKNYIDFIATWLFILLLLKYDI